MPAAPRQPAPARPELRPQLAAFQAALPGSRGEAYLQQRGISLALAQPLGVGSAAPGRWPHVARDWRGTRWTGSAPCWRRPRAGASTRSRSKRWWRSSPPWSLGSCSRWRATCARGWCPARRPPAAAGAERLVQMSGAALRGLARRLRERRAAEA